ncbi:MAG: hypothetical protein CL489_16310 [Acidobacteria bacterium]|jgi:drug/metabolite transporter (DMT)-like permease|nr:hypothetical protein [Acidobacteriota bacterium]MBF86018.1 hypothetical protein [Acidobacteriota bacterium]|tara:strand:+ start:1211 stop:2131 length:921 start_codon:yes stop_codon:yes gene_type:complete
MNPTSRPVAFLLIGVLCFIWGSTWPIIKIGLDVLPPFLGAGFRFLVAAIVLFGLSWLQKVRLPRSRWAHLGLLGHGVFGIGLSYGVVYWGEQYIPAGLSAVLFATNPLFVMLLAHLMLASEPMTLRKLVGVVLGFLGVLLIFKDGLQLPDRTSELAAAVTLVSPFVAALSNVGIKRWGQHLHPYNLTALPMTYAAAGLLVVSVLTEDVANVPWTGTAVGSVMYLALVGSVAAFVIFYTLLKQFTVSTLAFITYVFPIVAIVLGYLLLGETMEMQSLAGATIIAIGIIVATRPYSSRPLRTVRMDGC